MRAHLRIKMRRHLDAVRGGERRGAQPAGDAADAFEIGHDVIGGASRERRRHGVAFGKVLPDLDRGLELAHERGIAGIVVMADRLFQPINAFLIERAAAFERLGEAERLVVIDHDRDLAAYALLHRMQRDEILCERGIAEPKLDRAKAAGEEFFRLVGQPVRGHQTEAAGVIGRNALGRAAEKHRKRPARGNRQRVPGRHVKPGHRHAHDALHADERETLGKLAPELDGREALAVNYPRDLHQHLRDRCRRRGKIRPEIRAAGDPFLRFQVDEEERRLRDDPAARAQRIGRRHLDRGRANRTKGQLRRLHASNLAAASPGAKPRRKLATASLSAHSEGAPRLPQRIHCSLENACREKSRSRITSRSRTRSATRSRSAPMCGRNCVIGSSIFRISGCA